jgi:serine protease Do
MTYHSCLRTVILSLVALALLPLPRLHADLTKEQVMAAKSSTGMVITSAGSGTAFCISESGIFVTCDHVIDGANADSLAIVITPAGKEEKRYPARVVRRLKDADLAILKIALDRKLPVLKLGDVSGLFETEQVYAFGYPFGNALAADARSYPAVSVNLGRISSLRQKGGVLESIQLDAQVNPGNSGGPVLDPDGTVVGIVEAGVPGSGVNFAIPVSLLNKQIATPIIGVTVSKVDARHRAEPAEFTVSVDWLLPSSGDPKVSIEIRGDGPLRKIDAEKGKDGKYRARIVPFPEKARTEKTKLQVALEFENGKISGAVADCDISIAGKATALREIGALRRASTGGDFLADGKPAGPLPELASLALDLGGTVLTVDARKAKVIQIQKPSIDRPSISYKAVVTLADGTALSSEEKTLNPVGNETSPPPLLNGKVDLAGVREINLPAPISDIAAAQDGRSLLLYMKESRKLAVFDVIDLKIRGYISLEEDNALIAGGSRYILVVCPSAGLIQRYSIETLQKERTASNSFGDITTLTMGMSSPSLAMMISAGDSPFNSRIMAFDAERMTVVSTADSQISTRLDNARPIVRVSADGRTFGLCRRGISPTGFTILTYRDNDFSEFYEHVSFGALVPNADGSQIFTSQAGVYTNKCVAVVKSQGNWSEGVTFLPSYHPMYFLSVPYNAIHSGREKKGSKPIGIYLAGASQALLQMSDEFKEMHTGSLEPGIRSNEDPITLDKRYHFYPQLDVLITIPPTNDKIVARPLNVRQILDEKGIDYLYVTSIPPLGKVSSPYRFKLEAASKSGAVKFALQSGPAGLTVADDGTVAWNAPAKPVEETVIVSLKDSSSQEAFHTFRIVITE